MSSTPSKDPVRSAGEARNVERLVLFSDAVVAIAATLLVLPLVELAPDLPRGNVGLLWTEHRDILFAFVVSFAVIAQFWTVHRHMWSTVTRSARGVVAANFVWLIGIVFLPLPTQVLATNGIHDPGSNALYVGTLCVIGFAGFAQQWLLARDASRLGNETGSLRASAVMALMLAIALVVSVAVPSIGIWALVLLALDNVGFATQSAIRARRAPARD